MLFFDDEIQPWFLIKREFWKIFFEFSWYSQKRPDLGLSRILHNQMPAKKSGHQKRMKIDQMQKADENSPAFFILPSWRNSI